MQPLHPIVPDDRLQADCRQPLVLVSGDRPSATGGGNQGKKAATQSELELTPMGDDPVSHRRTGGLRCIKKG